MNQKALTTQEDSSRFALLERLEDNIRKAFRRGLDATRSMGTDFNRIKEEQLYTERGYTSFFRYVEEHMQAAYRTVERIIDMSKTAQLIEDAGLRLPANETLLRELTNLEPESQKTIWKAIVDGFPDEEITAQTVRIAVEQEQRRAGAKQSKPRRSRSGIKTSLDKDEDKNKGNGEQDKDKPSEPSETKAAAAAAPDRIRLTQDGEKALNRIRALCGEETATGIETCSVAITERDLIKWADQSDVIVKNLAHYVVDKRWSVRKALDYEDRIIDGETSLNQLIILARARGGVVTLEHQDYNEEYRITIKRVRILEA